MNELDQFLQDFYGKYAEPGTLTPEKLEQIKRAYGQDYDALITGLYKKYNPSKLPDSSRLAQIKQAYGFIPAQANEPVERPDTWFEGVQNAFARGSAIGDVANVLNPHKVDDAPNQDENLAALQQANQAIEQNPGTAGYERFTGAKTFGEGLSALADNPIDIISQLTVESLVPLVKHGAARVAAGIGIGAAGGAAIGGVGAAPGAGIGAIVGLGSTSLNLEYAGSIMESLKEAGADFESLESIKASLQNPEVMEEAKSHALKKGVPIAAFDMASAGIAGRLFAAPAKTILGKVGQGAAELGVQSAMGAGGELAGQVVSGEEIQPGAILSEAVGELGSAPIEIGAGLASRKKTVVEPEIADAEASIDTDPSVKTADPTVDATIDLEYEKLAAELDQMDLEGTEEAAIRDLDNFSSVNEENELLTEDFTPQEAGAIQASVRQSPQQQELLLDDSEATPDLDGNAAFREQDSERQEFESNFTSEELDQMSEEDFFTRNKEGREAKRVSESTQAREAEQQIKIAERQEAREAKAEAKQKKPIAPTPKVEDNKGVFDFSQNPLEKKVEPKKVETPVVKKEKPVVDPEQQKLDRTIKFEKQFENIKKDKPNKQIKRLEILNENTLDLPELNAKVREQQEFLKGISDEKVFKKQLNKLSSPEKLDLIAARVNGAERSSIQTLKQLSEPDVDESTAFENFNVVEDAFESIRNSNNLLSNEKEEVKKIFNDIKKAYDTKLESKRKVVAEEQAARAKETKTQKDTKDNHLTAVAKAVEQKDPGAIANAISAYQSWRKETGLKSISDEDVKKHANADFYKTRAHRQIQGEALERRAQEKKVRNERAEQDRQLTATINEQTTEADLKVIKNETQVSTDEEAKAILKEEVKNTISGVKSSRALSKAFKAIIKRILNLALGFAILINLNFTEFQGALKPIQVNTEIGVKTVPSNLSGLTENGKRAYFSEIPNKKSFVLVDKPTATVYIIDKDGQLIKSFPAILGAVVGDSTNFANPKTKIPMEGATTPAIRTILTNSRMHPKIVKKYEGRFLGMRDARRVGIHQVYAGDLDARLAALATPSVADNRRSWGCINITKENWDAFLKPNIGEGSAIIITPDIQENTQEWAINNLKKNLGFSEDTDVKLLDPSFEFADQVSRIENLTFNDLFDRIGKFYPNSKKFLAALKPLVLLSEQVSNKFYKKPLEIVLVDTDLAAGGYFTDKNKKHALMINRTAITGATDAHEIVHFIAQAIVNSITSSAKGSLNKRVFEAQNKFYGKLDLIHNQARQAYRDKLLVIKRKLDNNEALNTDELNFSTAVSSYLGYRSSVLSELNSDNIQKLVDNSFDAVAKKEMYGFANSDEMLAETFSNPYFMTVMALLESNQVAPTPTTKRSFFREIIDVFKDLLADVAKAINMPNLIPVKNSYLELLTTHMERMETEFLSDEPIAFTNSDAVVPNDPGYELSKRTIQENSAKYLVAQTPKVNRLTPELKKLLSTLANKWWKRESIQSADAVLNAFDPINKRTTKNKLGNSDAQFVWKIIQKYRQQLADAKTIQANSLEFGRDLPEYKQNKMFKRDLESFGTVDLDRLTRDNIKDWQKGILELVTHGIPSNESFNIVNKDQATKKLGRLQSVKGKLALKPGILKHIANPATYSTILSKYNKAAAHTVFREMYGQLLRSRVDSQKEANAFMDKLIKIVNSKSLSHSDFARVQMYGTAYSTFTSPTEVEEHRAEVLANIQGIVENAQNKLDAYNNKVYRGRQKEIQIKNELKIAQELLKTITANPDPDAKVLTTHQQELYDEFRKFLTTYENEIERNSKGLWGDEKFKKQFNYFPTFALGKVRGGMNITKDEIIPNDANTNLWEATNEPQNAGKIVGRRSGNTREKVKPKGYFYDYDVMSVANKFAAPTLFDLYASRELKQLNHLLVGNQGNPITFNGKDISAVMSDNVAQGLVYQIKSIVGTTSVMDKEVNDFLKVAINARTTIATAMMVTAGQFLTQPSSAFPAAIIMNPTGFPKALKVMAGLQSNTTNFSTIKDFIEREGLTIQLRDILFERFNTIEDFNKSGLGKKAANTRAHNEAMASYAIRSGDKFSARLVWFSSFFANGGTLEKPTIDAVLEAERVVGLMQNMSDVSFSAPIFRSAKSETRILVQMLYAFKSFALNSAINTFMSFRYSLSSGEARRVFTANVGMAAAYHAVALYAIRPFYEALGDAVFGEDDDEDEEKNFSKEEQLAWNMIWDLMIGQGSPAVIDAFFRYGVAESVKAKKELEGEEFNQHLDLPLYAPTTVDKVIAEGFGGFGDLLLVGKDIAIDLPIMAYKSADGLDQDEELDFKILQWRLLYDAAILNKWVPLRGDMQKLIREYDKKLKAQKRASSKTFSPGGEEAGTEFEFPEYEFDFSSSDPTELPEFEP